MGKARILDKAVKITRVLSRRLGSDTDRASVDDRAHHKHLCGNKRKARHNARACVGVHSRVALLLEGIYDMQQHTVGVQNALGLSCCSRGIEQHCGRILVQRITGGRFNVCVRFFVKKDQPFLGKIKLFALPKIPRCQYRLGVAVAEHILQTLFGVSPVKRDEYTPRSESRERAYKYFFYIRNIDRDRVARFCAEGRDHPRSRGAF